MGNMGSGLSREHSVKSAVKSSPRQRQQRPKGSLHSLIETDEEEADGAEGCDCDCCREECDCVSEDGHTNTLQSTRQERKLRCMAAEAESSSWLNSTFLFLYSPFYINHTERNKSIVMN
jgi:hypothetical protein